MVKFFIKHKLLILFKLLLVVSSFAMAKTVSITDFGVQPNSGKNTTDAVKKALIANRGEENLVLLFPKGRYDFYQDQTTKLARGFNLINQNNITIDGQGSTFIFHGKMAALYMESSENITLKNFNIDWDRPYISQGQIVGVSPEYVDIKIDAKEYPFEIKDGKIAFKGEDWSAGILLHNLYDKEKKEIVYRTYDNPFGKEFFNGKAEQLSPSIVRFYGKAVYKATSGTYISMLHARYLIPCFSLKSSKNIMMSNIDIFHSTSMGVVALKSENISLTDVNVTVNEEKGRVFSAIADAFHFTACKGLIKVDNCSHAGQADDFVNIHNAYVPIKAKIDDYHILTANRTRTHEIKELLTDDEIWFVDSATMQRSASFKIKKIEPRLENGKVVAYSFKLDKKLPENMNTSYYLESKAWNPDVLITNCKILKKHRARGILVTTPNKVIIENNYFNTSGAAILIEGDLNYWFESGAVNQVNIRNNTFENCATSGKNWGEAVITIRPSIKPQNNSTLAYHNNIKIENNLFKHFDYMVLSAISVNNLRFTNNTLQQTQDYIPFGRPFGFSFNGCRNVLLEGNKIANDFLGKTVEIKHMNKDDIKIEDEQIRLMTSIKK
jgi:hypothetical protein